MQRPAHPVKQAETIRCKPSVVSEAETRIAAVDYGRARIGVAVSDELGFLAHPRPFVPARPPQRALRRLVELFKIEEVGLLLVGLPRNMDGTEGASAARARRFGEELATKSGLEVSWIDERLTTVQAQGRLRQAGVAARHSKDKIDSAAAAIMLQTWLDGRRLW